MTLKNLLDSLALEYQNKQAVAERDYLAGEADCKDGLYDKWYRYNRDDDGQAYNFGWMNANRTVKNDNVSFVEYDIYNLEKS